MDHDDDAKIIEQLAKFHAKISTKGRVAIPKETRAFYEIEYGDFVGLIVRKMDFASKTPIKRAFLVAKLSTSGQIVIPKKLQEELELTVGELVEIALVGIIRTREILSKAPIPREYIKWITKRGL